MLQKRFSEKDDLIVIIYFSAVDLVELLPLTKKPWCLVGHSRFATTCSQNNPRMDCVQAQIYSHTPTDVYEHAQRGEDDLHVTQCHYMVLTASNSVFPGEPVGLLPIGHSAPVIQQEKKAVQSAMSFIRDLKKKLNGAKTVEEVQTLVDWATATLNGDMCKGDSPCATRHVDPELYKKLCMQSEIVGPAPHHTTMPSLTSDQFEKQKTVLETVVHHFRDSGAQPTPWEDTDRATIDIIMEGYTPSHLFVARPS